MDKSLVANGVYAIAIAAGLGTGLLLFPSTNAATQIDESRITSALSEMQAKGQPAEMAEAKSRVAVLHVVAALAESRQCPEQQTWLLNQLSQSAHVEPRQVMLWLQQSRKKGCAALPL